MVTNWLPPCKYYFPKKTPELDLYLPYTRFHYRQSTFVFRKPSIAGLKYDKSRIGRIGFIKRMEIKCKMTKTRCRNEQQKTNVLFSFLTFSSPIFRVIKTIRMSMSEMLNFISQLPEEGRVSRWSSDNVKTCCFTNF